MTTYTDRASPIYTTLYTDCKDTGCLQRKFTIHGQPGKQIRIDSVGCSLATTRAGASAIAWVMAVVDGVETTLGSWEETSKDYKQKINKPAFLADSGKDVIVRFHLKTSTVGAKAKIKLCSYTYSFVDSEPSVPPVVDVPPVVETPPEDWPASLLIMCSSQADAEALIPEVKKVIGENEISIWTKGGK